MAIQKHGATFATRRRTASEPTRPTSAINDENDIIVEMVASLLLNNMNWKKAYIDQNFSDSSKKHTLKQIQNMINYLRKSNQPRLDKTTDEAIDLLKLKKLQPQIKTLRFREKSKNGENK